MRKLILAFVLLLASASLAAQTPTILPGDALAFDYGDQAFTDYAVTGFEVTWDNTGTWQPLASTPFKDASTGAGATSYAFVPPFQGGNHTVTVRACNAVGCGGGSNPFAFAYVVGSVPPAAFGNFRKR